MTWIDIYRVMLKTGMTYQEVMNMTYEEFQRVRDMTEEQRCPICGLRPGTHISSQTYQQSWGTMTVHYYSGSSTEPFCFGHQEAQPTGRLKDLQRLCKRQSTPGTPVPTDAFSKYAKRAAVPKVFLDAFKDEELQL